MNAGPHEMMGSWYFFINKKLLHEIDTDRLEMIMLLHHQINYQNDKKRMKLLKIQYNVLLTNPSQEVETTRTCHPMPIESYFTSS